MPQVNPDEPVTDEIKTYNDESIGRDEGHDLNDIKGDLVDEDDGDEIQQGYNNKVEPHRNGDVVHRRKDDIDRDHPRDLGPATRNFSYPQQDITSIVPGLNPLFSNGFLSSTPRVQSSVEPAVWNSNQDMFEQDQYYSMSTNTNRVASLETELTALIETSYNYASYSNPVQMSQVNKSLWDIAQRSLEVAFHQEELRQAVVSLTNTLQSQVPYGPYMPPYVGSLFCGGSSPIDLDGKQVSNRPPQSDVPPMYPLPGQLGQIPNPLAPWSPSPLYPLCTAAVTGMLRYPYPFPNFSTSGAMGSVPPFPLVPPHPHGGGLHPNMLHPGGLPFSNHLNGQNGGPKSAPDKKTSGSDGCSFKRGKNSEKPNRPYVKKPLNAFMLYMKEQRAQVVAECTLKESAAINQILGRKWHSLKREEQQKYYDMARKERQLHMQMFPGWSARDNYGKRKKRKKEKTQDCTAQNPKKCRAVFGLEQQQLWCAPCRRKKKCIRYQHDDDDSDDSDSSPGPYQGQEMGSYSQPGANLTFNSSDSTEQPNTVTSGNSTSSQSEDVASTERTSPNQSVSSDRIKQERSPPMPLPGDRTSNSSSSHFHSPAFSSAANESSSNSSQDSQCPNRSTDYSANPTTSLSSKHRSLNDERYPPPSANGIAPNGNKTNSECRDRRPQSHSESPLNNAGTNGPIGRHNIFNTPMLSPGINMTSPHNSPHAFLPNFSSYFAAASLPTSPLGGLMNLPNFKSLASPMNMGLKGPGSTVPPGGHPGGNASRHATSALEGKS